MTLGVVGRKLGMTRVFDDTGVSTPVTVIEVEKNRITARKTADTDGYSSVQITTGQKKTNNLSKAEAGHFAKSGVGAGRGLWEFRIDADVELEVGGEIGMDMFEVGQKVDVTGTSIGKGFAGGFQSGLSWRTILGKREAFRSAFSQFDIATIATFTESDVDLIAQNVKIVRNRRKIRSTINNALRALELQQEFGSIAAYFWQFEPSQSQRPRRVTHKWLAENTQTQESVALAKALKKRGWTFVGPTNMYALMQAYGIVNDHVHGCPRKHVVDVLRGKFVPPVMTQC